MIVSITAEKLFDKIKHPWMIIKKKKGTLSKLGIGGNFFNPIKGIYVKPTANISLNGQRLMPHCVDSPSHIINQEKKGTQTYRSQKKK